MYVIKKLSYIILIGLPLAILIEYLRFVIAPIGIGGIYELLALVFFIVVTMLLLFPLYLYIHFSNINSDFKEAVNYTLAFSYFIIGLIVFFIFPFHLAETIIIPMLVFLPLIFYKTRS